MKRLIFSLLLIVTLGFAEASETHRHLPYAETMALLESIRHDAIVLGEGETDVHVFLDPLCPHSRKFIGMVAADKKMLAKYRYLVYLYTIPRLHSEATVSAIYASPKPDETLLKVMVAKETIAPASASSGDKTIEAIAAVARKIDVYKRPYLIVEKNR